MEVIEVLSGGIEVISRISSEWIALCNEGASNVPFFRPEWFTAFVRNFEENIILVTVRLNGNLRAVLPMVEKRGYLHGLPVKKLQAVFNLNTQRFDLIHGADEGERETIVKAVWKVIKENNRWDIVEMRLVEKDSWLGDILPLAEHENFHTGIWRMDSAPFIALPQSEDKGGSIADYFKGSRKHLRQELDRRLRRLREVGTVDFVVTTGWSPELTKTYFELEAKGWKGRGGTAASDDPLVVQLHEEFANAIAKKQSLLTYELRLDGKTIAMSLNIRSANKTIHWKTSYDEEYARYSPGNLLFRELLNDCIRNDSSEIDFLSPTTPNKLSWASGEREHVSFYIFRRGLLGFLLWTWKFRVIGNLRHLKSSPEKAPELQTSS